MSLDNNGVCVLSDGEGFDVPVTESSKTSNASPSRVVIGMIRALVARSRDCLLRPVKLLPLLPFPVIWPLSGYTIFSIHDYLQPKWIR